MIVYSLSVTSTVLTIAYRATPSHQHHPLLPWQQHEEERTAVMQAYSFPDIAAESRDNFARSSLNAFHISWAYSILGLNLVLSCHFCRDPDFG